MKIKYNRISSNSQNLERQQLNKNKFDLIIDEFAVDRPHFLREKNQRRLLI